MTTTKIRSVLANVEASIYNPGGMQDAVMDTLLAVNNGENIEVLDPNNPVVFSVEVSAVLSQAYIETHANYCRRDYAVMATEFEDLYGHMSDMDFLDPFAQPSRAEMVIILNKEEIRNKAVPRDSSGIRKLVIPKDSNFTIAGYTYSIQYPVEIRILPHGGFQVVYDTTYSSPLLELSTNTLDWEMTTIPANGGKNIEALRIKIPAMQYRIRSYNNPIIPAVRWSSDYTLEDQFFFCQVWNRVNGKWIEIPVTHSVEIIDPLRPSAQVRVYEKRVNVHIPDVYIRSGLIKGDIRVDIFTTKGKVDLNLGAYSLPDFTWQLLDVGKHTDPTYFAPLKTFSSIAVFSGSTSRGGRNALSFEEMRERVIENSMGVRKIPISEGQLVTSMLDKGYSLTPSIDTVTRRIYYATSAMPGQTIPDLSTPIGTVNGILDTSYKDLTALDTVKDNGKRITIQPNTLYRYRNGLVELDDNSVDDYLRLDRNSVINLVNSDTFLFSPFHYVLDINGDIVEARPYYLTSPRITNKRYVSNNTTLALEVSTADAALESTEYGYRLIVKTRSGDTYKSLPDEQCHCQLSFTPRNYNGEYAYVHGVFLNKDENGERVYEFQIRTNLDIDRNHDMILENFTLAGDKPSDTPVMLETEFNIIYSVSGYTTPEYEASVTDAILRDVKGGKAVTHEKLRINLGMYLKWLWANARTVAGTINYRRYPADVYKTWLKDVHATKEGTDTPLFNVVEVDGKSKVEWKYKHRKGDLILDETGEKIILHAAGDIMLDGTGHPILEKEGEIVRTLDLFLMDAKFIFSKHRDTKAYMSKVTEYLLGAIGEDMVQFNSNVLEQTNMFYYPRSNMGLIDVLLGDGTTMRLDAEIQFMLNYYLTKEKRSNEAFLKTLAETTRSSILTNLKGNTVSTSAITSEIRKRLGGEIVDVEMEGMGLDRDQKVFTVTDDSHRPVLGKKLAINANGDLVITDDISIGYHRHEVGK